MEENKETNVAVKANVGDQVIDRVNKLSDIGFVMPKDFNYINAIKGAMLMLRDVKDKNNKSALEVCTSNSISTALFQMCVLGLDITKKQAYPIIYGNELKIQQSYFGTIVRAKRASKNFKPIANVIREGDEFVMGIDAETGLKKVIKHETSLANISKPIVGAYAYVTDNDGVTDVEVMDILQIKTAWAKSKTSQNVHKDYPDQMAIRTVINRAVKKLINASPDNATIDEFEEDLSVGLDNTPKIEERKEYTDFDEVTDDVDTETGEIKVLSSVETKKPRKVAEKAPEVDGFD